MNLLDQIVEVVEKRAWRNGRLVDFIRVSRDQNSIPIHLLDPSMLKKLSFLKKTPVNNSPG